METETLKRLREDSSSESVNIIDESKRPQRQLRNEFEFAVAQSLAADLLLSTSKLVWSTQEIFPQLQDASQDKSSDGTRKLTKLKSVFFPKKFQFANSEQPFQAHAEKAPAPKKVFEVSIAELNTLRIGEYIVPLTLYDLVTSIRTRGLTQEGIFRVSGNARKIKMMRDAMDSGEFVDTRDATVHDFADNLKYFLRNLPEPIIPENLTSIYIACAMLLEKEGESEDVLKSFRLVHLVMPRVNRDSLKFLLDFFAEIASLSASNKMDALNISKVMVPNICKYENEVPLDVEALLFLHTRMAKLMAYCIKNYQAIFEVPDEILNKLHTPLPPTSFLAEVNKENFSHLSTSPNKKTTSPKKPISPSKSAYFATSSPFHTSPSKLGKSPSALKIKPFFTKESSPFGSPFGSPFESPRKKLKIFNTSSSPVATPSPKKSKRRWTFRDAPAEDDF